MAYKIEAPMGPIAPIFGLEKNMDLGEMFGRSSLICGPPLPADVMNELRAKATLNPELSAMPNIIKDGGQWIVCEEFKEAVEGVNKGDAQFIPVDIQYPDTRPYETQFYFMYPLFTILCTEVFCFSLSKIEVREVESRLTPGKMNIFRSPLGGPKQCSVVVNKRAVAGHAVWRVMSGWPDSTYVSDAVIAAWEQKAVDGLDYYPLREAEC